MTKQFKQRNKNAGDEKIVPNARPQPARSFFVRSPVGRDVRAIVPKVIDVRASRPNNQIDGASKWNINDAAPMPNAKPRLIANRNIVKAATSVFGGVRSATNELLA